MKNIENRPMPCRRCGSMVNGREMQYKTPKGLIQECRWVCTRCGNLVRTHEELVDESK